MNETELKPFVKWAGGKSKLLPEILKYRPTSFDRYIEPFVGGGALLFRLNPEKAIINDSNGELINCYEVIRDSPTKLVEDLRKHKNNESYYYTIRKLDTSKLTKIERASRFIFLNRTCFNGLWRVNKKNQFNTPFGRYKNPVISNEELIKNISKFLRKIKIFSMDFEEFLIKNAKKGDFIYLDPPYHPISKYSDFKRYTKDFFEFEDQQRLADLFNTLDSRGCKLLLSNSFADSILKLYSNFETITVFSSRSINSDPDGRGLIKEVLIRNYE